MNTFSENEKQSKVSEEVKILYTSHAFFYGHYQRYLNSGISKDSPDLIYLRKIIKKTEQIYEKLTGEPMGSDSPGANNLYIKAFDDLFLYIMYRNELLKANEESLRKLIIKDKAYTREGALAYKEFKKALVLLRKANELFSSFTDILNSVGLKIDKSPQSGIPDFSAEIDALHLVIRGWDKFQEDSKAIEEGDKKTYRKIEEETFRWIAGAIAFNVEDAWNERLTKLLNEGGFLDIDNFRKALAEYKRWKAFAEKTQLFERSKPILLKRTFWRAWDWIPAPYKIGERIIIKNEGGSVMERRKRCYEKYFNLEKEAETLPEEQRKELYAKMSKVLKEIKFWDYCFNGWDVTLEISWEMEKEATHARKVVEEAVRKWKQLKELHGEYSPEALRAWEKCEKLTRIAELKEKKLEEEKHKRYLFENEEVDRKTYETVDYNSFYPRKI